MYTKNISREPIGYKTLKGSLGLVRYLNSTLYKLYTNIVFEAILALFRLAIENHRY